MASKICGNCGQPGHNRRTCTIVTKKDSPAPAQLGSPAPDKVSIPVPIPVGGKKKVLEITFERDGTVTTKRFD